VSMRQGFFRIFRVREKSVKSTGLYSKVEMPSAFGRLPPSATVTCPGPLRVPGG